MALKPGVSVVPLPQNMSLTSCCNDFLPVSRRASWNLWLCLARQLTILNIVVILVVSHLSSVIISFAISLAPAGS